MLKDYKFSGSTMLASSDSPSLHSPACLNTLLIASLENTRVANHPVSLWIDQVHDQFFCDEIRGII